MLVPIDTADDARLIAQIHEGDGQARLDAFAGLVQRYGDRLQRYLAARGFARPEREDVAGEAWMRAWHGIDRYEYREEAGFFPWLRKIADYVSHEFTRQHYLTQGSDRSTPDLEEIGTADSTSDEAVLNLTREEIHNAIKDILRDVPNDDWKIVIEAHLVDGWQTDEIMELYAWSRSKVYVTKLRAFRWLEERLLEQVGLVSIEEWLGVP